MEEKTLNANARAVLDVLREMHTHPTALELYDKVRLLRPHIGVATVYRILHQLTEQSLICEIGRDVECRYDANTSRHDHAICTACGALLDVPIEVQIAGESLRAAAQSAGLELSSHEVRMYGRCKACQNVDVKPYESEEQ